MHRVIVEREIEVPKGEAWSILDDFGAVYRYHPIVEASPIENGIPSGLGAERVCHFDNGDRIKEKITEYEAGEAYTVEIVDTGNFPLKRAVARISLTPVEDSRSRVRFEMSFEPKYGPVGWLMGATVMQTQFKKTLSRVLEGQETHALTGRVVSRSASLADAA